MVLSLIFGGITVPNAKRQKAGGRRQGSLYSKRRLADYWLCWFSPSAGTDSLFLGLAASGGGGVLGCSNDSLVDRAGGGGSDEVGG